MHELVQVTGASTAALQIPEVLQNRQLLVLFPETLRVVHLRVALLDDDAVARRCREFFENLAHPQLDLFAGQARSHLRPQSEPEASPRPGEPKAAVCTSPGPRQERAHTLATLCPGPTDRSPSSTGGPDIPSWLAAP